MCTMCMMTQTFDPDRHESGQSIFEDDAQPSDAAIIERADARADTSTIYTISVGDTFFGNLLSAGDRDWVGIQLEAGQTYQIDLAGAGGGGGTLSDTYLRLYSQFGTQITFNDDGGPGLDSSLSYTPTTSGTFYIAAGAWDDRYSGTYSMSVTTREPAQVGTLDEMADYLTDGYWNDQGGSGSHFNTSGSNQITVNISALTAAGQQLARWAFEAWESVANIQFVETFGSAQITFDDDQSGAFAQSFSSGGFTTTANVNVSTNWLSTYGTTIDSYSFSTYVHEIGHALGLGHQGNYNGNATYGSDETFSNDSWQLSIMSYFSQNENSTINASQAGQLSAMMADIIAIQNLYGAPGATGATGGNTTWGANSNLTGFMGTYFAALTGGPTAGFYDGSNVAYTIYDQGGTDTLNLSYSNTNDRISLWHSTFSDVAGLIGNIGIARDTIIENVVAGDGSNTIDGNGVANSIFANGGNDTINGAGGNDTAYGGAGNDLLSGGTGDDQLWGGTGNNTFYGEDGNDRMGGLTGNDQVWGGAGNDTMYGDGGVDTLSGGIGNDEIWGGTGNDLLYGEAGNDLLGGGTDSDAIYAAAGNDTVYGYNGNDTIYGGSGADELWAGNGADLVSGGDGWDRMYGVGGNDTLDGGTGNDTMTGDAGADSFVFDTNYGADIVTDFDRSEGDRLRLDDALWTGTQGVLSTAQVVSTFGTVSGGNVVLNFGGGNTLTLNGINTLTGLDTAIDIF